MSDHKSGVRFPAVFETVRVADTHDVPLVEELLRVSSQRQLHFGVEDLGAFQAQGGVLVGQAGGRLTAALIVDLERRPATLPVDAPDRIFLRGLAVRHGIGASAALCELLTPLRARVMSQPRLLIAHGGFSWYNRALTFCNFMLTERVGFLELRQVARRLPPLAAGAVDALVTLRPGGFADVDAVALLDAAAFSPIWHFSAATLRPLLLQGQFRTAWHDDHLVGYWLMNFTGALAHVARLAVHPQWQGRGIGRQLMLDVLHAAVAAGCRDVILNTQTDNRPSQRLYRSLGFLPTGEEFAVYTMVLPPYP